MRVILEHFSGSPANRNSPFPNTSIAPPFTSVNGDGEVWSSSQGPQGTTFTPYQGFYFIELLTNDASPTMLHIGMNQHWEQIQTMTV